MTDESQFSSNPNSDAVPRLWVLQLAEAFSWAERHPVKLAAASIALPSISLSYYLHSEHIPLSILSSDVISGLPSLLAMICAITLALFAFALMPLMVMFEEAETSRDGSLQVLKPSPDRKSNVKQWLVTLIVPGLILAASVVLMATHPGHDKWGMPTAIILAGGVFTITVFRPGANSKNRHWLERTWLAVAANLVQMLLSLLVMRGVLEKFPGIESYALMFALLFGSMVAMASSQIILVILIEVGSKDGEIVARVFHASLMAIAIICIFPPTGGWLAGRAISSSASGGMGCLHLVLTGDKSDFASFVNSGGKSQQTTKELSIRAATSSLYYVRLKGESDGIGTIPTTRVSKFVECVPLDNPSKSPPSQAASGD